MGDTLREEELHMWKMRIKNGMFEPQDLCEFTLKIISTLEESNRLIAQLDSVKMKWDKLNFCTSCGKHEVSIEKTCHNSGCNKYAEPVTVHETWKDK